MAGIERGQAAQVWRRLRSDVVWMIMAANLAVYLLIHLLGMCGVSAEVLTAVFALPSEPMALLLRPWTLVLYMFTQADFLKLLFNMLWFWSFATISTRLGQSGRFVALSYLWGGLASGVTFVTAGGLGFVDGVLIGASAATLGVIGATAVTTGDMSVQMMVLGRVKVRWLGAGVIAMIALTDATAFGAARLVTHLVGAVGGTLYGVWEMRRSGSQAERLLRNATRSTNPGQTWSRVRRPARQGLDSTEQAELDALLERVKRGGYVSLSAPERQRLFELSSKIK